MKKLESENISLRAICSELHWMARRYCDGRQSYAPSMFNELTKRMLKMGIELNPTGDEIIWARDAMGRAFDGLTEEQATPGTRAALSSYRAKRGE